MRKRLVGKTLMNCQVFLPLNFCTIQCKTCSQHTYIPAVYHDGFVFSTALDFLNHFNHYQQAGTAAGRLVGIPAVIVELCHLMVIISLHVIK